MSPSERGLAEGVRSKAAFRGHPIHPMLIPLPIGFLIGAFLADLAYAVSSDPFFARAAPWLTGAGVVSALGAAVFGFTDFAARRAIRSIREAWLHFFGNLLVVVLAAISWGLRAGDPVAASVPVGLVFSAVWSGILLVTGWLGGELSYRYGVGMQVGEQ
jgi:uncharacterized membrane protein